MAVAFSGKEATANYICAYVRGVLRGGASLQDRVNKEKLVCVWEEYSKNQTMSNRFLCYFI